MNPDYKTFYRDFTIAETCGGAKDIRDTYKRAFAAWKDNVEYFAALVLTLNHKIWEMHDRGDNETGLLYDGLWRKAHSYGARHFKGKDAEYYYNFLD